MMIAAICARTSTQHGERGQIAPSHGRDQESLSRSRRPPQEPAHAEYICENPVGDASLRWSIPGTRVKPLA